MTSQTTVLIVEDEALLALTLKDICEAWGYLVYPTACTTESALQCVTEHQPDIVLMDMHVIGNMDSIELAERIQAVSGARILFMTGAVDEALKKQALRLDPLAYMLKPLHLDELRTILQEAYPPSTEI
jgi:CheY-like chemotaxis protein